MSAPLSTLLVYGSPRHNLRNIDNWYHLESTAESSAEIVECQRVALRNQTESASEAMERFNDLVRAQELTNDQLDCLNTNIEGVNDRLDELRDVTESGFKATSEAINNNTSALNRGFAITAEILMGVQVTLREISHTLQRPYETKVLELRNQAESRLRLGLRNNGRDRDEDLRDAMALFREVTNNAVGNQDYVTWFNIGYILWKQHEEYAEAEQAFYRAARLSAHLKDAYYLRSVWHQSHMQYLQGKAIDAAQTLSKIAPHTEEAAILFDMARYEAKLAHPDIAIEWLNQSIEKNPLNIVVMAGELDFSTMLDAVAKLVEKKTIEARRRAMNNIEAWNAALELANDAERQTEGMIELESQWREGIQDARLRAQTADYLTALEIEMEASACCQQLTQRANEYLSNLVAEHERHIKDAELIPTQAESKRLISVAEADNTERDVKIRVNKEFFILVKVIFRLFALGVAIAILTPFTKSNGLRMVADTTLIISLILFLATSVYTGIELIYNVWVYHKAVRAAVATESKTKSKAKVKLEKQKELLKPIVAARATFVSQYSAILNRLAYAEFNLDKKTPAVVSKDDLRQPGSQAVVLDQTGEKKIQVIKVIREATGLNLPEAKAIADSVPSVVARNLSRSAADLILQNLRAEGATAHID